MTYRKYVCFCFIILLIPCTSYSDSSREMLNFLIESQNFTNIYVDLIPENEKKELEIKSLSKNKSVMKGSFNSSELYKNYLEDFIQNNDDKLYGFLRKYNYLSFNEYSLTYERNNSPGVFFARYVYSFHRYMEPLKSSIIHVDDKAQFLIAKRKFEKLTYSNEYMKNIDGVNVKCVSIIFEYSIKPTIDQLSNNSGLFEGRATFMNDPTDGKWKLYNQKLNDNGITEITKLIQDSNIIDYFSKRRNELVNEFNQRRQEAINNSKIAEFIVGVHDNQEYEGLSTYLGLISTDFAVKVEPLSGKYNRVHLFLADAVAQLPTEHKNGDTFKTVGLGGNGYDWTLSGLLFWDIQKQVGGESFVMPKCLLIKLFGQEGSTAKVTVYRVEATRSNTDEEIARDMVSGIDKLMLAKKYTEADIKFAELSRRYPDLDKVGISGSWARSLAYYRRVIDQNLGKVDKIIQENTFTLEGLVTSKSEQEGSGAFWSFQIKTDDGNNYGFMCNNTNVVYFKLDRSDIDSYAGYQKLRNEYDRVKLYIPNSQKGYVYGSCKNRDCNGTCPSAIVMLTTTQKPAEMLSHETTTQPAVPEVVKIHPVKKTMPEETGYYKDSIPPAPVKTISLKPLEKGVVNDALINERIRKFELQQKRDLETIRNAEKLYQAAIYKRLQQFWSLPEFKKWDRSLTAVVVITISQNGSITNQYFETRSGDKVFDQFVEKTLHDAVPLPQIPAALRKQQYEIALRFKPTGMQ